MKTQQQYLYRLEMKVRDYECDLQGVVNNANYLHYMEHTRHEFLLTLGEDFESLHRKGTDLFVRKVELTYLRSLRSGDLFVSALAMERSGAKLCFRQDLYLTDGTPVCKGIIEAVAVVNGTVSRGEIFDTLIDIASTRHKLA
mgnify:FL=1